MTPPWTAEQDAALRDWHLSAVAADTPGRWAVDAAAEYRQAQRRARDLGLTLDDLRAWRIRQEQT